MLSQLRNRGVFQMPANTVYLRIFAIPTLIVILVFGVIIYVTQSRTLDIVIEHTQERIRAAKRSFMSYLHELEDRAMRRAELLANQSHVINAFRYGNYEALKTELAGYLTGIDLLTLCDADGNMLLKIHDNTYSELENISDRADIAAVLKSGMPVKSIALLPHNILAANASAPIYDGSRLIGIVNCNYDLTMPVYLDIFAERSGCDVALFRTDSTQIVSTLMDPGGGRITNTRSEVLPLLNEILTHESESLTTVVDVFGKAYGVHYSPLKSGDMTIAVMATGIELEPYLDTQRTTQRWTLIVLLFCIFLTAAFLFAALRYAGTLQQFSEERASLSNIKKLMFSLDSLIVVTDRESDRIIFINKRAEEEFNFKDSASGKKCWELFFPEASGPCEFCLKKHPGIYSSGESIVREIPVPLANKRFKIICRYIDWPDGSRVFLAQYHDITELKASIDQARDSDARMQMMLDTSPLGVNLADENFTITDCNKAMLTMFGISSKEEYCANFRSLSPLYQPGGETSDDLYRKAHMEALEKGFVQVEWMHQKQNGEPIPCAVTLVRSTYKGKDAFIAHIRDLREVKEMDARLREADMYTQLLLDAMPVVCTLWNTDLKIINCNQETLKLFEVQEKQDFTEHFTDFMPEFQPNGDKSAETGYAKIREAFDNEYTRVEWMHKLPSGEPLPCEVTLVRVQHCEQYFVAAYTRDLREHNAYLEKINLAQEKLRQARDAAEEASRTKSVFLANVSHEIRTPLNSIMGFTSLAEEDALLTKKTKEYLNKIFESAKWLLQIINDILDISKIEAGKLELECIPFDLHEIFAHCQSAITPKTIEKGISMYYYAEPSIGKKLLGDPVKLYQALINLLSNAVKFTNTGMIKLLTSVSHAEEDSVTIYFEIKDSGIGIEPDLMTRIFDPFIQADSSITRKYGGTGLGLTITKHTLEMMGGKLKVESTPGIGSKFSFELTFKTINDTSDIMAISANAVPILEKPYVEGEVLICEDNTMNQQVIREHLERVGLTAMIAENGKEGVDIVTKRQANGEPPFDLILMDIHMPVMDGLEASSRITKMGIKTPIVAVTANVIANNMEMHKSHGICDILGKPFTPQELWACLKKHLSRVRLSEVDNAYHRTADARLQKQLSAHFVKKNQNTAADIRQALDSGDTKTAHRIAHTLKSNAGQLGKSRLQRAAAVVEDTLAEEKNMPSENSLNVLENELDLVLNELAAFLTESKAEAIDKKKVRALLAKLEPMLIHKNPECIHLLEDVRKIPGAEELARQAEDLEFSQAMSALHILQKEMGIRP